MSRTLLRVDVGAQALSGTGHLPEGGARGKMGFLVINPGPAPRAGNSDLSVRLADHLASLGFPCFRFDLPGLGDTPGPLPADVLMFWRQVQSGALADPTLRLARHLRESHGLEGMIVGGMCSGAITSILAADRDPGAISGLLLIDPEFKVMSPSAAQRIPSLISPPRSFLKKAVTLLVGERSWRKGLLVLIGHSRLAQRLRPLQPLVFSLLSGLLGRMLPRELHRASAGAWRRTLARKLPTLLVTVPSAAGYFRCKVLLASFPRTHRESVMELPLPGTNHILTWGNAREVFIDAVGRWAGRFGTEPPPSRSSSPAPRVTTPPVEDGRKRSRAAPLETPVDAASTGLETRERR